VRWAFGEPGAGHEAIAKLMLNPLTACRQSQFVYPGGARFHPIYVFQPAARANAASPIFRFTPNRDFVYRPGWDFVLATAVLSERGLRQRSRLPEGHPLPLLASSGSMIGPRWCRARYPAGPPCKAVE
jgi:hypothetical protein